MLKMIVDTIKERLLAVNHEGASAAIQKGRVKLVRHTPVGNLSDEILSFDPYSVELLTAEQRRDIFSNIDYVFCFLAENGTMCSFSRCFRVDGLLNELEFSKRYPGVFYNNLNFYYKLTPVLDFDDYWNRLVIDWGNSTIAWHQKRLDKVVFCIRPRGFIRQMPSWDRVILTFSEMRAIFSDPEANSGWYDYLSNHDGIYLIRHRLSNKMYVGSACSLSEGIWGRWSEYIKTTHGGNKGLIEILQDPSIMADDFVFSLLEVFQKGVTKKTIISAEGFHKERLGTRTFGLNRN